jgi:hypothetical protein
MIMNKIKCVKKFRYRYMVSGIIILCAMFYVISKKINFYSKEIYNIFFLAIGVLLGVFYTLRGWLIRLEIRNDELFFWDGLVDFRHIKFNDLDKIEYNPEIRIRFYMRDKKKTKLSIPNVFDEAEVKELLEKVAKKKKWISLEYIDKEKVIDTSKRIVRSKPIRKIDKAKK